jgi:hypothetical protein
MKSEDRGFCLLSHESNHLYSPVPVGKKTGVNPRVGLDRLQNRKKSCAFPGSKPRILDRLSRNRTRYRPICLVYTPTLRKHSTASQNPFSMSVAALRATLHKLFATNRKCQLQTLTLYVNAVLYCQRFS